MTRFGEILRTIDGTLRGHFTRNDDLASGRIVAPVRPIVGAAFALGCAYGAFMGLFALLRPEPSVAQFAATVVKVPLLFLLTLFVTLPSLYVFSALFDSRLRLLETLRLLSIAILVDLALLASFGPVTAFFTLSTDSYPFMVLLNVAFFVIAGLVGLRFLRRALAHVFAGVAEPAPPESEPPLAADAPPPGAPLPRRRARAPVPAQQIFRVWVVIYAVVGAQMAWILRPFIGNPEIGFALFRPRGSNFFAAVLHSIQALFR